MLTKIELEELGWKQEGFIIKGCDVFRFDLIKQTTFTLGHNCWMLLLDGEYIDIEYMPNDHGIKMFRGVCKTKNTLEALMKVYKIEKDVTL